MPSRERMEAAQRVPYRGVAGIRHGYGKPAEPPHRDHRVPIAE